MNLPPSTSVETHNPVVGYLFWIAGFTGAHRFYVGRQLTGLLYALTLGLLGIGWVIDAFRMTTLCRQASSFYVAGKYDYNVAWLLFAFLGVFGAHRFYLGKHFTAVCFLLSGGLLGFGLLFDLFLLNEQVNERNKATFDLQPPSFSSEQLHRAYP